jgi:hypothetical protein
VTDSQYAEAVGHPNAEPYPRYLDFTQNWE